MSSDRIKRKRRSEFDTRDNSADEQPAEKIRRVDSALNLGQKVSQVCKNLLSWITPGFLKRMATRVSHQTNSTFLRTGTESSYRNRQPVEVDENDLEEITVIGVQNGTGAHSRHVNSSRLHPHPKSSRLVDPSICPLASTPDIFPYPSENPYYNKVSRTVERKKMNGYPGRREDKATARQSEKCVAPITSPRSEIDILFGDDAKKGEVEILNEVFPTKHSSLPTRKIRLLSESHVSRNDRSRSRDDLGNNSITSPPYCNKSYTANEVFRLQEKAQYKLLLDKVVKRPPLYTPAYFEKDSRASTIQLDLTEDDDISNIRCHFKKEKVEGNVKDFLSKYYKPCTLVSSSDIKSRQNFMQSMSEKEVTDDEDVQVIEYTELPTWKPRKPILKRDVIYTETWFENMKITVSQNTKDRLHLVSESEGKVQRYQTRREALTAEENRRREKQRLAGFIYPEDVDMDSEVLPEITSEMDAIIERAFNAHPGQNISVVCVRETFQLQLGDINTLNGLNWLNDQVINFYLALVELRGKLDGYPRSFCFNSFFYPRLAREGVDRRLLRWTKKQDLFAHDLIFVPVHLELHWALLVVDNRTKVIKYYDSMGGTKEDIFPKMENYLICEMKDKKNAVLLPKTYSFETPKDIPKQMNGCDCGMFALKYAEYLSRNASLSFTQEHMPYFRRRMVYELVTQQIL